MSRVADLARVAVLLADYAAPDPSGRINILGAGWNVTGANPTTGQTPQQSLVVLLDFPPELYGEDFTLSLQLRDSAGALVELPGPTGQPQPMRIAQVLRVEEPPAPLGGPRNLLWAHSQTVFTLLQGLPLRPNELYTWCVEIDGDERPERAVSFYVAGPPPTPVIG